MKSLMAGRELARVVSRQPKDLPLSGQRKSVEKLWQEFFAEPSWWWDNRAEKVNPRYPDFKHKKTQEPLWLDSKLKPPWVEAELAEMVPGTVPVNLFTWNRRLTKYAKAGQYKTTMETFQQMQREGMISNKFTFIPVLNSCSNLRALAVGRLIHSQIIQAGYESDLYVGSCLVDMYANCGSIEDAQVVFDKMPIRDVVVWNTMLLGHVRCGHGEKALGLYVQMQQEGVEPSTVSFLGMLSACASVGALEDGRHIHAQIMGRGWESHVFVGSSLVDMYAKCGSMEDAQMVFNKMPVRNVVAWSAMIQGHVKCGEGQKALRVYRQMRQEGVEPDPGTFVGVLNACTSIGALEEGRHVHKEIIRRGWDSDVFLSSSLVDMYAKCGSIEDAWTVFNKMATRDVVIWNAMILGHVRCGQAEKALELSQQMRHEGVEPTSITCVGILNACASAVALEQGRLVHEQIIQRCWESDIFLSNSLIDMYAKCGSIEDAQRVFRSMPTRNVVSWSVMMAGYAMHGHGKEALEHFKQMCQEGLEIDGVTFLAVLSACGRGGLVDEGMQYFESMCSVYSISPTVDHYACTVDLLGRAGHLHEAENLVKTMSCEPSVSVWMSLLSACRVHGNMEMGERVAKRVANPENAAGYVLLSNIYANSVR